MIYFDNSASSLIKPICVKRAIVDALNRYTANPGRSGHRMSQLVGEQIFETRELVKQFFNAGNYDVVFTKNCTEALNLAIFGSLKPGDHVITSCYEHNSVLRPLTHLKSKGVELSAIDVDLNEFHLHLKDAIKQNTAMVVLTAMSNVTGEQPNLIEVAKICKQNNIKLLIDGAQASGHKNIDMQEIGADLYTFSGHKGLCSITGVGGLLIKNGMELKPFIFGGTGTESENLNQPNDLPEGLEAGTISTISIISLKAGLQFLQANFTEIQKKEHMLSNYLYLKMHKLPRIRLYNSQPQSNVVSFNIFGAESAEVADILNEKYGICVRSGLHCAPLIHKKLGTMETGAVRVSLDFNNTKQEIDYFVKAIKEIALTFKSR